MSAAALIEQVRAAGGQIEANGATIRLRAPKPLPDALIAELRRNRDDLLPILAAVNTRRMRELGIVPPHYTAVTECAGCGLVPIFPGVPSRVLACPWCLNRAAGRPMPRLKEV